ncbi:Extracellular matrix-binding ebh, putative [Babesia ovata]|uniref:Extracellular matrix-binding ebh, putative n=1 Tax=Babesia ovata TaxID=189622 RepID=A0A2H6K8V4_9APIC|nr:Extracellular matrix-binding ebh, putative [Babesia ovata]GBE59427.1 Extracellular matrix-binding ebh, putative [Babesia ovata]
MPVNPPTPKPLAQQFIMQLLCTRSVLCTKVDKKKPEGVVFNKAKELQNEGKKLGAAEQAKKQVGNLVTKALDAVVRIDTNLKKDLKNVKESITKDIADAITSMNLLGLEGLVKGYLKELKSNILKLKGQVTANLGNSLVKGQLTQLNDAKIEL